MACTHLGKQSTIGAGTALHSLAPKGRGWGEGVTMIPDRASQTPLHVRKTESAQAVRCVGAGGRRPRRGWAGPSVPLVPGTADERGPSVLRLLSSTDDREHVPHSRQGSVRTRDQGQSYPRNRVEQKLARAS